MAWRRKIWNCFKFDSFTNINDCLKFLILGALLIVFEFGLIPFRQLGYLCKDPNLTYVWRGDTIPFAYLMVISITVPFVLIFMVELIIPYPPDNFYFPSRKRRMFQALRWFGQLMLGFLILLLFVQLCKCLIAEPRPHFFSSCKPDKYNCSAEYIVDFKCTNTRLSERALKDSVRSFPSGHAALGVYVALFLAWYYQNRIPRTEFLIVPWFQCMFAAWGLLCALTRVTDHRHHWWDVFAGAVFGVLMAVFTVKGFCNSFQLPVMSERNLNEAQSSAAKNPTPATPGQPETRELRDFK